MAPSLDKFPDLCLIAIFMRLPLSDLLAVIGLVCARWRGLLPTVLPRRHTLKIVQPDLVVERSEPDYMCGMDELIYRVRRDDGSPWVVRTKVDTRNVVVVPKVASPPILTEPFTNGLMDSLPNIASLTVVFSRNVAQNLLSELFTQITRMLNHWQDSLVTLNLSIRFNFRNRAGENINHIATNLLEPINRLRSLRHLKLDIDFPLATFKSFEPELRIISQLNTFAINSRVNAHLEWIIRSINQYANSEVITQINSGVYLFWKHLFQISPTLTTKFHYVGCYSNIVCDDEFENIETFCTRFTSVRSLYLGLSVNSLHTISPSLAQLQHLVHLRLNLSYSDDGIYPGDLAPIPSVRLLTIQECRTKSHKTLGSFRLPELFPNVQVFKMLLISYDCRDCDYVGLWKNRDQPAEWQKVHECKRLARQALTRFPKLHTIELEEYPGTSGGAFAGSDIINSLEQL